MLRFVCTFFLILLVCTSTFAQEQYEDSLRWVIQKSPSDTGRVSAINELTDHWIVNNLDSAEVTNHEALNLSKQLDFRSGYFEALIDKSEIFQYRMMTDSAALVLRQLLRESKQYNDKEYQFWSLNLLGTILSRQGRYDSAYACFDQIAEEKLLIPIKRSSYYSNYGMALLMGNKYERARRFFQKADSTALIDKFPRARMNANYNWAIVEYYLGNFTQVLERAQLAFDLAKEDDNLTLRASALEIISVIYQRLGDFEKRLETLEKAENLHRKVGGFRSLVYTLQSKVKCYMELELFGQAIDTGHELLKLQESLGPDPRFKIVYNDLAGAYFKLNQLDSARYYLDRFEANSGEISKRERAEWLILKGQIVLNENQIKRGEDLLLEALALGKEINNKTIIRNASKTLYKVMERQGDYRRAFEYLALNSVYRDSLLSERKIQDLTRMQVEFEAEQREKAMTAENEKTALLLQSNAERQALLRKSAYLISGIVLTVLILVFAFLYDRRRKRQRDVQAQHDRLKELDQLKSRYFTNIAHELRTPLSLILGPVDDVLDSASLNEQANQKLKIASRSGKNMLHLINEMLDLSKLQKRKVELQTVPTDLEDFVRTLTAPFQALAEFKQLDFSLEYMPMMQHVVMLDQQKLQKIIYNLLANAFKFTSERGKVIVVVDLDGDDAISIKVKDTGKGMPAQDLPHIFDAYYQTSEGRTQQVGTGIGLALSRELVQLMGGEIDVDSIVSKGTTFMLKIPLIKAEKGTQTVLSWEEDWVEIPALQIEEKQPSAKGKRTILLVEDHPDMAVYVKSILTDLYEVIQAENGLKALEVLNAGTKVDLIISDVMMPEMDGFELLKSVRSTENHRSLPFILLTARADQEDRLKGLLTGVDEYMTKPFDQRELKLRIANLFKNQLERREAVEKECPENESRTVSKDDLLWIQELEKILHRELANTQFNMTSLADELAMSERNLRYRLKKITGLSPYNYFREIKLKGALELLEARSYQTVAQVAYKVGFEDPKHFSKIFFQRFGKRPSDYLHYSTLVAS